MTVADRLLSRRIVTPSGCWEFDGARDENGYGRIGVNRKNRKAHRVAAWLWLGAPLTGEVHVCHHCDNPPCFNPNHLYLGNNSMNMRDSFNRTQRRPPNQRGEKHSQARLTESEVRHIRDRLKAGETQADLGREYGVTHKMIWRIDKNLAWTHVQ
jgi:HNH endonuclease